MKQRKRVRFPVVYPKGKMKSFQDWFENPTVEGLVEVTHLDPKEAERKSYQRLYDPRADEIEDRDNLYNKLDITSAEIQERVALAKKDDRIGQLFSPNDAVSLCPSDLRSNEPWEDNFEPLPPEFYSEEARVARLAEIEGRIENQRLYSAVQQAAFNREQGVFEEDKDHPAAIERQAIIDRVAAVWRARDEQERILRQQEIAEIIAEEDR